MLFADGKSMHPGFSVTVLVDEDQTSITAITPAASIGPPPGVDLPGDTPDLRYLSPNHSFYTAEVVVLGTVVDELPLRRDPIGYKGWAVFAVSDDGACTRVTGQELDPESGHEFPLSELEGIMIGQDKEPSRIE